LPVKNGLAYCGALSTEMRKKVLLNWSVMAWFSSGGLYYKTLRIHNVLKMNRLLSKLACSSKPEKLSDNNKDTSLLNNPHFLKITNPKSFIVQAPQHILQSQAIYLLPCLKGALPLSKMTPSRMAFGESVMSLAARLSQFKCCFSECHSDESLGVQSEGRK